MNFRVFERLMNHASDGKHLAKDVPKDNKVFIEEVFLGNFWKRIFAVTAGLKDTRYEVKTGRKKIARKTDIFCDGLEGTLRRNIRVNAHIARNTIVIKNEMWRISRCLALKQATGHCAEIQLSLTSRSSDSSYSASANSESNARVVPFAGDLSLD